MGSNDRIQNGVTTCCLSTKARVNGELSGGSIFLLDFVKQLRIPFFGMDWCKIGDVWVLDYIEC